MLVYTWRTCLFEICFNLRKCCFESTKSGWFFSPYSLTRILHTMWKLNNSSNLKRYRRKKFSIVIIILKKKLLRVCNFLHVVLHPYTLPFRVYGLCSSQTMMPRFLCICSALNNVMLTTWPCILDRQTTNWIVTM